MIASLKMVVSEEMWSSSLCSYLQKSAVLRFDIFCSYFGDWNKWSSSHDSPSYIVQIWYNYSLAVDHHNQHQIGSYCIPSCIKRVFVHAHCMFTSLVATKTTFNIGYENIQESTLYICSVSRSIALQD